MSLHTPPLWSVFRELNYTPLERRSGERRAWGWGARGRDGKKWRHWAKLEFALRCVANNVEIQFSGTEKSKHQEYQLTIEPRLAVLLYCALLWQQLNQVMMWGSLIVTNTVTETWLSSCSGGEEEGGESTQSTYRGCSFPSVYRSLIPPTAKPGFVKERTTTPHFYAMFEATCVNLCGLFEAPLICSIRSSETLMSEKRGGGVQCSCGIKNSFPRCNVLINYSVWKKEPFCFLLGSYGAADHEGV